MSAVLHLTSRRQAGYFPWRRCEARGDDVVVCAANMVKKQRGKKVSLSKTTIIEKTKDNLNLLLSSSDDEAPEEVTFEESKAQALQGMKQALDSVRR